MINKIKELPDNIINTDTSQVIAETLENFQEVKARLDRLVVTQD